MSFIVIEMFGGPEYAIIVTDQSGNNFIFEMQDEAEKEAANCQDGLVVDLN